jgi:hypothetical protein
LLEFQDYPGGWILPNDSQRSTVVEYLKNSPVTIIAIDTPALIEKDGQYNEPINMSTDITYLLREAYEADNNQSPQKRLVIFAPVKCEKYMQANQTEIINIAIKKRYQTLLGDLKQRRRMENQSLWQSTDAQLVFVICNDKQCVSEKRIGAYKVFFFVTGA